MKIFIFFCFLFSSFVTNANTLSLIPGIYHLEWAYGKNDNYKIVSGVIGGMEKIGNNYYFKNKMNDQSNDEVYIVIDKTSGFIFYKHEEIEGGPTIGWANILIKDGMIVISPPTTKNFYDNTNGDSDFNVKYKIGNEFPGHKSAKKDLEMIPMQIIKEDSFKVDCQQYFKLNKRSENKRNANDSTQSYSSVVLLSDDGLCNSILNKHNKIEVLNGWMLFKRVE